MISRRNLLTGCVSQTAAILVAQNRSSLQLGTMDGVLKLRGQPESIRLAKQLGLAAVQVTLGQSYRSDPAP